MNATRKVKLKDLNPNLTCHLCQGYFIDATTIIECLHSFCRSCIVQHLEKSEYCPVCDVQLHSSKPLSSIRSDHMLQEIVYKLVPGLFQNEMIQRRKYYAERPASKALSQQDAGHVYNESYISSDDIIHLSLELYTTDLEFRESTKRYIKCPAAVSISILKKLLHGKYDLNGSTSIDILYRDRNLPDDFLLMDIAYKYSWTQHGSKPLQLCYRVHGLPPVTKTEPHLQASQTVNENGSCHTPKRRQSAIEKVKKASNTNTELKGTKKTPKSVPAVTIATPNAKPQRGRPKKRRTSAETEEGTPKIVAEKKLKRSEEGTPKKEKKSEEDTRKIFSTEKKRKKLEKAEKAPKVSKKAGKLISDLLKHKNAVTVSSQSVGTEVQLRISENGVMCATSVSSGEEKIIVKGPVNPNGVHATKLPHNNFNGRTQPSPPPEILLRRPPTTNGNPPKVNGTSNGLQRSSNEVLNGQQRPAYDTVTSIGQQRPVQDTVTSNGQHRPAHDLSKTPKKSFSPDKPKKSPTNGPEPKSQSPWKFSPTNFGTAYVNGNGSPKPAEALQAKASTSPVALSRDFGSATITPMKINVPSPLKDGTASPKVSSPKRPPKFFKSRHTETNGNGDSNLSQAGSPAKGPEPPIDKRVSPPTSIANSNPNSSLMDHLAPGFRFPLGYPMNLVPFVTSNFCSMPFYNNGARPMAPNNPYMAMSLGMNEGYGAYQTPASQSASLDLSTRRPVSSYVQISPKKSHKKAVSPAVTVQEEPLSLKVTTTAKRNGGPEKGDSQSPAKKAKRKSPLPKKIQKSPNPPVPAKVQIEPNGQSEPPISVSMAEGVTRNDLDKGTVKGPSSPEAVPSPSSSSSPMNNNNNNESVSPPTVPEPTPVDLKTAMSASSRSDSINNNNISECANNDVSSIPVPAASPPSSAVSVNLISSSTTTSSA